MISVVSLLQRVPEPYLRALFGSTLASRFVYTFGLESNEFAFHSFVTGLVAACRARTGTSASIGQQLATPAAEPAPQQLAGGAQPYPAPAREVHVLPTIPEGQPLAMTSLPPQQAARAAITAPMPGDAPKAGAVTAVTAAPFAHSKNDEEQSAQQPLLAAQTALSGTGSKPMVLQRFGEMTTSGMSAQTATEPVLVLPRVGAGGVGAGAAVVGGAAGIVSASTGTAGRGAAAEQAQPLLAGQQPLQQDTIAQPAAAGGAAPLAQAQQTLPLQQQRAPVEIVPPEKASSGICGCGNLVSAIMHRHSVRDVTAPPGQQQHQ